MRHSDDLINGVNVQVVACTCGDVLDSPFRELRRHSSSIFSGTVALSFALSTASRPGDLGIPVTLEDYSHLWNKFDQRNG